MTHYIFDAILFLGFFMLYSAIFYPSQKKIVADIDKLSPEEYHTKVNQWFLDLETLPETIKELESLSAPEIEIESTPSDSPNVFFDLVNSPETTQKSLETTSLELEELARLRVQTWINGAYPGYSVDELKDIANDLGMSKAKYSRYKKEVSLRKAIEKYFMDTLALN